MPLLDIYIEAILLSLAAACINFGESLCIAQMAAGKNPPKE
jgi:hypothetical protein